MSSQLCRGHAERSVRPAQHGAYAGCHHAAPQLPPAAASPPSRALCPLCALGPSPKSAHTPCACPRGCFAPSSASCQHRRDRSEPPRSAAPDRVPRGRCEQSRAGVKTAAASPVLPLSAVQPLPGVPGLGLRRTPAVGVNGPAPAPGSSWSRREEGMRVNPYQDSVGTQ